VAILSDEEQTMMTDHEYETLWTACSNLETLILPHRQDGTIAESFFTNLQEAFRVLRFKQVNRELVARLKAEPSATDRERAQALVKRINAALEGGERFRVGKWVARWADLDTREQTIAGLIAAEFAAIRASQQVAAADRERELKSVLWDLMEHVHDEDDYTAGEYEKYRMVVERAKAVFGANPLADASGEQKKSFLEKDSPSATEGNT
jgi:hypothetical protein